MSDTAPKSRGRPATGTAKTAAQRMAESRARGRHALDTDPDWAALSDTAILEALRMSYRRGHAVLMVDPVRELFERANERARYRVAVTFRTLEEADNTATVADNPEPPEPPGTKATQGPRCYPPEVKRQAVAMADEGHPTPAIRAAILNQLGRAPDQSNMAKLIRAWRASA